MDLFQNLIALPGPETVQNVFFPGLGLNFDLNRVAVIILGRPIYWYGIIITCGLLLAVFLLGVFRAGYIPSGFIYTQF